MMITKKIRKINPLVSLREKVKYCLIVERKRGSMLSLNR